MMVPSSRAAEAAEIAFRFVRASAVQRVSFLMVDPAHFKAIFQTHDPAWSALTPVHRSFPCE
jgi:hypothetical protein